MHLVFIILSIIGLLGIILFLPIKGASSFHYIPPATRNHEADAVLSRRLLIPGSEAYDSYYNQHPDLRQIDDRSRQAPGLLSDKARNYHPGTFAAAKANFEILETLSRQISGPPASNKILAAGKFIDLEKSKDPEKSNDTDQIKVDPRKVSQFIWQWLKQTGAHSIGFTPLMDYHLYSHKGRGPRSGDPIMKTHEHVIAITVEMDFRLMKSAPEGTSVMESSEQYLRSGVLALKLAAYIRELGYDAAAHIDGNYDVICPLVAVDAGLGVLGRMGLLMTPKLGPRVRISVVTTNMPLASPLPGPTGPPFTSVTIVKNVQMSALRLRSPMDQESQRMGLSAGRSIPKIVTTTGHFPELIVEGVSLYVLIVIPMIGSTA